MLCFLLISVDICFIVCNACFSSQVYRGNSVEIFNDSLSCQFVWSCLVASS